jgi:hypothetical protein
MDARYAVVVPGRGTVLTDRRTSAPGVAIPHGVRMVLHRLLPATTAVISALALAAPVAGAATDPAATSAPPADVCAGIAAAGPMAVLGPYGPLGDYGPTGKFAGQENPGTACGGAYSFALPGFTVGSFVTANLSLAGQAP